MNKTNPVNSSTLKIKSIEGFWGKLNSITIYFMMDWVMLGEIITKILKIADKNNFKIMCLKSSLTNFTKIPGELKALLVIVLQHITIH